VDKRDAVVQKLEKALEYEQGHEVCYNNKTIRERWRRGFGKGGGA
jgi:hypothetical protein